MSEGKGQGLLGRYLRDRARLILSLAAMAGVFAAVIALYALPVFPAGYAALLSGCVGLAGLAADFYFYRKKHRLLAGLFASISLGIDELPPPSGLIEEDYQNLIRLLHAEKGRLTLEGDRALSDMEEYYTLWAHQIKTPIAAMNLLLQSGKTSGEALGAELFKIEQYVEMALVYMRLSSHESDYLIKNYALDPIIRQAVRKYSRLFILKGVSLEYETVRAQVRTDEKWLLFVIEQVLSNAVKYTPAGKVSVTLSEGHLVIRDSGIGIPPEDLPRVFDKGYTGYNGRVERRSTGLGLYLSRRVLRRLGHTISIHSAPGEGTAVSIGFPRRDFRPE